MGYDMVWVEQPDEAGLTEARDTFEVAVLAREALDRGTSAYDTAQAAVEAAYERYAEADVGYFRINIWGMSTMRALLEAAGALTWEPEGPDFDELPKHDAVDDEEYARALALAVGAETGGVLPGYKIASNDGWHVTPAECQATALAWVEGAGRERAQAVAETAAEDEGFGSADEVLAWADGFVRWIGEASQHGGFLVY